MVKKGDIGFSSNIARDASGVLASVVRWLTKSFWSHAFIIQQRLGDEETVQEASKLVSVVPFNKHYRNCDTQLYVVYRIKSEYASDTVIDESLRRCFDEFAGVSYGNLQLLWFGYRAIMELFGRDVRHESNWMSNGVICSELVYYFLHYLGEPFQSLLSDLNPDTIQPEDLYKIIKANPDIFEIIEEKIYV